MIYLSQYYRKSIWLRHYYLLVFFVKEYYLWYTCCARVEARIRWASPKSEWIKAIQEIISNDRLREKIIDSARQTVEERYSVSANELKYIEILNKLIKK